MISRKNYRALMAPSSKDLARQKLIREAHVERIYNLLSTHQKTYTSKENVDAVLDAISNAGLIVTKDPLSD